MSDKKSKRRGSVPPDRRADPQPPSDTDEIALLSGHPVLCLRHLQAGWGVGELTDAQCREFLVKWEKRAKLTWKELVQHPKHGLGSEFLPSGKFKTSAPEELERDRYMVFRHEATCRSPASVRATPSMCCGSSASTTTSTTTSPH